MALSHEPQPLQGEWGTTPIPRLKTLEGRRIRSDGATQEQARRLATLLVVNKRLALGPPLEETLSSIAEEATRLLGVEAAGLWLREGDELVRAASFGAAAAIMVRERLRVGESLSGLVVQEDRPLASTDLPNDPRYDRAQRERARARGLRTWLGVPLRGRDVVLGVLFVVDGTRRRFEQADIQLLEAFADQAAIAIENARLFEQVAQRERLLRELVGRLMVAQEEERRRVAYELHDGLAQVATATQQRIEGFTAKHRPRSAPARSDLYQIRDLAQQTVREARRAIAGLRPTVLDDFGLAAAIGREVQLLLDEGWQVNYLVDLDGERLPPTVETALFRVAQEALENVRKHARTTRAALRLERSVEGVRLEVRDWGRGFRPSAVLAGGGPGERIGLLGMRERVAWLGGTCTVESRPGEGTCIAATVPLAGDALQRAADAR